MFVARLHSAVILNSPVRFKYRSTKFHNDDGWEAERWVCTGFCSSRLAFSSIRRDEDCQLTEGFDSYDGPNFHNEESWIWFGVAPREARSAGFSESDTWRQRARSCSWISVTRLRTNSFHREGWFIHASATVESIYRWTGAVLSLSLFYMMHLFYEKMSDTKFESWDNNFLKRRDFRFGAQERDTSFMRVWNSCKCRWVQSYPPRYGDCWDILKLT